MSDERGPRKPELHGMQYWPIYLRETGEFVGCAGIRPYDLEGGVYELGFHLCARFWGRGLASEAAHAAASFAFASVGALELLPGTIPITSHRGACSSGLAFATPTTSITLPRGCSIRRIV